MIARLPGENTTLETRHEANETVDKKLRYKQILEILSSGKEMTAKEIAQEMYMRGYTPTNERNFVSPRITELLQDPNTDYIEIVGKKKCEWTNKMVTVFKIKGGSLNDTRN